MSSRNNRLGHPISGKMRGKVKVAIAKKTKKIEPGGMALQPKRIGVY